MYILYYFLAGIMMGFVCHSILKDKGYGTDGNPNYGFLWGLVFGILGLVVCMCKKRLTDIDMNKNKIDRNKYWICPKCKRKISIDSERCECGFRAIF